jgi:hypothetical protein
MGPLNKPQQAAQTILSGATTQDIEPEPIDVEKLLDLLLVQEMAISHGLSPEVTPSNCYKLAVCFAKRVKELQPKKVGRKPEYGRDFLVMMKSLIAGGKSVRAAAGIMKKYRPHYGSVRAIANQYYDLKKRMENSED